MKNMNTWHFSILMAVIATLCSSTNSNHQGLILENLLRTATQGLNCIYIFDDNHELHVRSLLQTTKAQYSLYTVKEFAASLEHIMTMTMKHNPPEDLHSSLSFVIFCGIECINSVLLTANVLDETVGQRSLLRHFSSWLIISPDHPSTVNLILDHVAWVEMDTINQHCFHATYNIFQVRKEKDACTTSIKGFYSLVWMPNGRELSLVHTYDSDLKYSSIFPNFKRGLNGRKLSATALEWSPFTVRRVVNNGLTYVGAAVDMFDILAETLNFSYVIGEPADKSWGKALENISLTGIIGQMNRAEVDFCVVPYAVSSERERFADITYPVIESTHNALYKKDDDYNGWMYPISCFSWKTYVAGLVTWIAVLGLSFIRKLASKAVSGQDSSQSYIRFLIEIGFSIPLRQNIEKSNHEGMSSSRIFIFSWCMFCFLITTVYVGNLVAFSTVEKESDSFNTLEDIANQNEYGVFVMEGDYVEGVMMTSSNPVLNILNKKIISINSSVFPKPKEIIQIISQKKYMLISPMVFTDVVMSLSCDIVQAKQSFFRLHSGFLFPPFSPLKRIFDKEFLRLQEYGTVDRLMKKWTPKPLQCNKSVVMSPHLKLRNVTLIGVSVSVLLAIAFVVLLFEFIISKLF